MTFPGLSLAATDARLHSRDVHLLALLASGELCPGEYRPLKETALRHRLDWSRATLYRSIRRLTLAGYLRRRQGAPEPGNQGRAINLYELVYSPYVAVPSQG